MAPDPGKPTRPVRTFRAKPYPAGERSAASGGTFGLVLAFAGWFAAIGLFSLLLYTGGQAAMRRQALERDFVRGLAESRDRLRVRENEIRDRREALTREINAGIEEQEEHRRTIRALERSIADLESRVDPAEPPPEAPEPETAEVRGRRRELTARIAELEEKLAAARGEYEDRYARMKAEFDAKRAHPNPGMLRQWYALHEHTVFAPAAAYLIGEDLYSRKRSREAARFYTEILERYPGSPYETQARDRLVSIRARKTFRPVPFTFEPYFPPDDAP